MDLLVRRMKEAKENYTAGSIGFYSSGQLCAEENYTLSVSTKAGIGTLHVDGNTVLNHARGIWGSGVAWGSVPPGCKSAASSAIVAQAIRRCAGPKLPTVK